ncbi:MAG: ImmA/IrrE family metallo-endopeptidase [Promethearchaeota archaeon]
MSKAEKVAKELLHECGIKDPTDLSLELIIASKNIIIKEENIDGSDGRIICGKNSAVITLDSNIKRETKRRFILTHELGHYLLHRDIEKLYNDNEESLNKWYENNYGNVEIEANEFAAEFLMPTELFRNECQGKYFGPEVIDYLSERFNVSKTAAILRFVKIGNHPICIVYSHNNRMKWWKTSPDFPYFLNFKSNQPPPSGSVANEIYELQKSYYDNERKQNIMKSTWFNLNNSQDKVMYEYCLYAYSYGYTISVLWED